MGKGKGAVEYWAAVVKPGRIMFEIGGVPMDVAKEGRGYLEDRRPASNVDPYKACAALIDTTCS